MTEEGEAHRWVDDLVQAAEDSLAGIPGRAIGYLAPDVELGGAIVSVGLIETDALDRDGVAGYLDELARHHPALLDHATSGGGGLLEGLRLRALLTASILTGELGRPATLGGLRMVGAEPLSPDVGSALRDAAAGLVDPDEPAPARTTSGDDRAPRSLADLLTTLSTTDSVSVQQVAPHRWIAYLPGSGRPSQGVGRLRLVGGDRSAYAERVVAAVRQAVLGDADARVMLVGSGRGGVTATEIAAGVAGDHGFVLDTVVTAGAPSSHVPRIPDHIRVLSLEDRSDPVALLGSLVNATAANRLTVVFDGEGTSGAEAYVAGGRAADAADHPDLVTELERLRSEGWLAG